MVLLLTDVFLLLTQVFLWLIVGLVTWFLLLKALPKPFLGLLVLFLILVVLAISFVQGPPTDGSIIEILWRIISFPFTPLGLGVILILILLSGRKLTLWARRLILGTLILLLFSSIPFVSYFLAQELESEAVELMQATIPPPPGARRVIVLLGQDSTRAFLRPRVGPPPVNPPRVDRAITPEVFDILSRLPVQLTDRGNSLIYAAQLYREEAARGADPLILISAGGRPGRLRREGERPEDISEARDIQLFLTQTLGIPEGGTLLDPNSFTARRSAEEVQRILVEQQRVNFGNQLMLVGTALNMNRAYLTFRQLFPDATLFPRPTNFYALPPADRLAPVAQGRDLVERQLLVTDFLPTANSFYVSSKAIEEYLNAFYYFLRGWIKPFGRAV
jgi:uncharacterized SAM-binding protein YcdF (DUF218 family)